LNLAHNHDTLDIMSRRAMSYCLVFAYVAWAQAALAAPARVKVFEAKAHKEPLDAAETVHTFTENTDLSVSEVDENGWRKVRLPNGGSAWIKSVELTMGEAATPLSAAPAPPPPRRPEGPYVAPSDRAPIFIKDLDHLASLVIQDSEVHPMALNLASKQKTADFIFWGGLIGGLGIALVPMLFPKDCAPEDYECDDSIAPLIVGTGVMTISTVIALAIRPGRSDLLDVLNAWNQRHPQEPFTIDSHTVSGH
jgi:hypothetical protein